MALDEASLIEAGLILRDHVEIALAVFQPSQHPFMAAWSRTRDPRTQPQSFLPLPLRRQLPISLSAIASDEADRLILINDGRSWCRRKRHRRRRSLRQGHRMAVRVRAGCQELQA